jgi:hypothetical protein
MDDSEPLARNPCRWPACPPQGRAAAASRSSAGAVTPLRRYPTSCSRLVRAASRSMLAGSRSVRRALALAAVSARSSRALDLARASRARSMASKLLSMWSSTVMRVWRSRPTTCSSRALRSASRSSARVSRTSAIRSRSSATRSRSSATWVRASAASIHRRPRSRASSATSAIRSPSTCLLHRRDDTPERSAPSATKRTINEHPHAYPQSHVSVHPQPLDKI